jgi:hypothetical protein
VVVLENLQNYETAPGLSMVYLTFLIFLGSFFFLNLMLAVIMESYMKAELIEGQRIEKELLQQK